MVITDLSMRNLYVCPDGRVVAIDTDSMEVAHYPGGGVTPTFAHPDVTEEYYFTRLRKAEHTNFPLAVLLFNILVGEDPLACCGHIDNLEWRKDKFPLSNDSNGRGCELNGMKVNAERLREWNSLSKDERECFINAFNFTEICDIGTWVKAMPLLFSGFRFLPKPADKDLDYLLSMYEI